jgi:hypothetical protein
MSQTHNFGQTLVQQHSDGCTVVLPGGRILDARPQETDSYRAQARAIGYGDDTAAMCREHDYVHALLAHALGLPHSPALMGAAKGEPINDLTGAEEDAVLAIQRFWNLARKTK